MTPEEIIASYCPCSEPGALIEGLEAYGYWITGRGVCWGCGATDDPRHRIPHQQEDCEQCKSCRNREWHDNPQ